jgi:hypothetical protein
MVPTMMLTLQGEREVEFQRLAMRRRFRRERRARVLWRKERLVALGAVCRSPLTHCNCSGSPPRGARDYPPLSARDGSE